jgi:hypothetical protein
MDTAEKPGSRVGHITLDRKRAGKPIAGNRHDGFDVAGAGNQLTVWLVRHSQRKRGATDRLNLRSMAPVLDPTRSLPGKRLLLREHLLGAVNKQHGKGDGNNRGTRIYRQPVKNHLGALPSKPVPFPLVRDSADSAQFVDKSRVL